MAQDAAEKRKGLAERDVRRAVHAAAAAAEASGERAWTEARHGGWSDAESSLHLALVAEGAIAALRAVAAGGALAHDRRQSLREKAAFTMLSMTWSVPRHLRSPEGTDPRGTNLPKERMIQRHLAWAADWLEFLKDHPGPLFPHLRTQHPEFGELDAFEWARLLSILARDLELKLGA